MLYKNGLEYDKPWISHRADPYVVKHSDGYYYFTATVPEYDRIILRRAISMEALVDAEEQVVWAKHDLGIMGHHIWAPELHYIMGKWYIYFAAGEAENIWNIRPYVLECSTENPLEGNWIEKGRMQAADGDEFSFKAFSLDATVFEHQEKYYYIWAEKVGVGKQISNLYIAELETPYQLKTVQVLLTTPDYDWERVGFWVNEGPAVIKHNGRIYLTFSASETSSAYCMGLMWADEESDLLDPTAWHKSNKPVVVSNEEKGIYGPGHNCFTTLSDGTPVMVYHARVTKEIIGEPLDDPNRHAMIRPITWNEEGTMIF